MTAWLDDLKGGNPDAARRLWERYFQRMIRYGRGFLGGADRVASDEEDIALSAFDSFCRGAFSGRFHEVDSRKRLWSLLALITYRKAADLVEEQRCFKRGGRDVRVDASRLKGVEFSAPPPDLAAELAEEFCRLLDLLPDPSMRVIAVLRFEGYEGIEIARHLGCGVRTVERKLMLIRRLWTEKPP